MVIYLNLCNTDGKNLYNHLVTDFISHDSVIKHFFFNKANKFPRITTFHSCRNVISCCEPSWDIFASWVARILERIQVDPAFKSLWNGTNFVSCCFVSNHSKTDRISTVDFVSSATSRQWILSRFAGNITI